jgi:hypothetical protein
MHIDCMIKKLKWHNFGIFVFLNNIIDSSFNLLFKYNLSNLKLLIHDKTPKEENLLVKLCFAYQVH